MRDIAPGVSESAIATKTDLILFDIRSCLVPRIAVRTVWGIQEAKTAGRAAVCCAGTKRPGSPL
jgi:hypothetical protein